MGAVDGRMRTLGAGARDRVPPDDGPPDPGFFPPPPCATARANGKEFAMFDPLERRMFLAAQEPFRGSPAGVNDIIQAEDFDKGGEGVAYHDTTAQNDFWAYRPEG